MKKILSVLLAVFMVFTLCACAKHAETSATSGEPTVQTTESVPELTEAPIATTVPTEEQPNAPPTEENAAVPTIETETAPVEVFTEEPAAIDENGSYNDRDSVALYIHTYGHLPYNYITKKDAQALGWSGGSVELYAPGMAIGGSRFGNYEGLLPEKDGRFYTECDIDTLGKDKRGAKRIVFSNDGLIYYTDDHYASFTLLYGEE